MSSNGTGRSRRTTTQDSGPTSGGNATTTAANKKTAANKRRQQPKKNSQKNRAQEGPQAAPANTNDPNDAAGQGGVNDRLPQPPLVASPPDINVGPTINTDPNAQEVHRAANPLVNAQPAAAPVNTAAASIRAVDNLAIDPTLRGPGHQAPVMQPAPSSPSGPQFPANVDVASLLAQVRALEQQLALQQGAAGPSRNGGDANAEAGPSRHGANAEAGPSRNGGTGDTPPAGSILKPRGSAGGGSKGYRLQDEMGLSDDEDGARRYNMILSTVRELAHAARLDLSKPYRHVRAEDLSRIFAMARKIHPFLARFHNDWATAAILKQYMSSSRRYGRRKGYFTDCASEARPRRGRNLDDLFDDEQ